MVQESIDQLRQAQDLMRDAAAIIRQVTRELQNTPHRLSGERLRSYISGHLEVLIDRDHDWLDRSINIENIIEELEEFADESLEEEEE